MVRRCVVPLFRLAWLCPLVLAAGGDWPQWRYDAARSGYTPHPLPNELSLQWTRDLPKPVPAWPTMPRCQFDATCEPVVAEGLLVVGSTNDGSVSAYRTDSGAQVWRVYTEGPVRFAPAVAGFRVFAGSDDGRLYCLDLRTGERLWVVRVAPEDRPDMRHLGNGRLISCWPVRGGAVIVGDTVVAAAGIWPLTGTFVAAFDTETGTVRWRNGAVQRIADVRIDHHGLQDAGLAPQGYLVHEGGRIIVPNGRSLPAGLDATTGELLWFCQGGRNGHWRVTAGSEFALVGTHGGVNTVSGREFGSSLYIEHDVGAGRWAKYFTGEAAYLSYKTMPGVNAWSVLADRRLYGVDAGVVYCYDLGTARLAPYDTTVRNEPVKPNRWVLDEIWQCPTGHKGAGRTLIGAGRRLYTHAGTRLVSIEVAASGGLPRVVWEEELPGTPTAMVAADDRLFVVCDGGKLLCFGVGGEDGQAWEPPPERADRTTDARTAEVVDLLSVSGVRDGYCLVLGLDDGTLVEALLEHSDCRVVVVDADETRVRDLRQRLSVRGLYGGRVDVVTGDPLRFGMPPCMASLVVSERLDAQALVRDGDPLLFGAWLRPYGGVACLRTSPAERPAVERWAAGSAEGQELQVGWSGGWALIRRPGAPLGSAYWSHGCADAARTYFSRDQAVKPPLAVLWYGEGGGQGFHKANDYGSGSKPQVMDGRLFALRVRDHSLHALDVYTGRGLWVRDVDPFTRYVSRREGIYVAEGDRCSVLEPSTGRTLRRHKLSVPGLDAMVVGDIRVDADVAVIGVAGSKTRNIVKGLWDSTVLVGLDRDSGAQLWVRRASGRFNVHGLAMGAGMVFVSDSASVAGTGEMRRRGESPETLPVRFSALDARTGELRWEHGEDVPFATYDHFQAMRSYDDWVSYSADCGVVLAGKNQRLFGFDASDGRVLWRLSGGHAQPVILRKGEFIPQSGLIFDVRTGKPTGKRAFSYVGYGCNYGIGGERFFVKRAGSLALFDTVTGQLLKPVATRSGCSHSAVPACGVLTVANFMDHCVCNFPVQTSYALIHEPRAAGWYGEAAIPEPVRDRIAAAEQAREARAQEARVAAAQEKAKAELSAAGLEELVPAGAEWRYLDDGSDQGGGWVTVDFDDAAWRSGPAQLGYGDRDESTVLGFGEDPKDKHLTYYFRHRFTVKDPKSCTGLLLKLIRDDGAIVYLNGKEVLRSNMPDGEVGHLTPGRFCGKSEGQWLEFELGVEGLRPGLNVLSAEVHQAGPTSSDISFDLQLFGRIGE